MILRLIIIAAFVVLLSGCPASAPIIQFKTVVISPPDSMLQDCKTEEPPDAATYIASNWPGKEKLLIENNRSQIKNISLCNVDKQGLRTWKVDQLKLYNEKK
jgi:hypothetical protein